MSGQPEPSQDANRVKYLLRHRCQNCNNVNTSQTAEKWLSPPVACGECGESTWELIEEEEIAGGGRA